MDPKVAAILSSLSAPIKGKPMKADAAPKPRPKTPSSPGLGAKMREETSHSLEKMLKQGAFATGLEDLVKVARGPLPTAPPTQLLSKNVMRNIQPPQHAVDHIVGSDAPDMMAPKPQRPVSREMAHESIMRTRPDPEKAMGVIGLPQAQVVRGGQPKPAPSGPPKPSPAGGGKAPPSGGAPARGGGGGGGFLGNLKMPRMGRTMGLVGLGAAGAAAYGMHQQNEEDRKRRSLVYAPLPGSLMQ